MYKVTVPQRGEITVPALLLTTTGRKSGDKFIFPLFDEWTATVAS